VNFSHEADCDCAESCAWEDVEDVSDGNLAARWSRRDSHERLGKESLIESSAGRELEQRILPRFALC
jgi:hypothetical protein